MNTEPVRQPSKLDTALRVVFVVGCFLFGFSVLAMQVFWYLKYGTWVTISIIDAGVWAFEWEWGAYPTEWLGVHKILNYIPLSAASIILGYFGVVSD